MGKMIDADTCLKAWEYNLGKPTSDYTIGERLKLALNLNKVKQKDLAKAIGVTDKTITRWINGTSEPHACHIIGICRFLGISSNWLLGLNWGD